jgi:uncharacterized protein YjgD (DUF1641 family)
VMEKDIQAQIEQINKKLDIILEEIDLQKNYRREVEDLKDDLMRVGKDVYQNAVEELDQIHDHVNTKDILHFGKYMLRNVNTISKVVQQLESTKDFLNDAAPLIREYLVDFMARLDEFDRRGYFEFIKESQNVIDKVVTSFNREDIKKLGDNIVTILNTVKNLTQPEMLLAINNALEVYKKLNIQVDEKVSLLTLLKEMNSPEVRKGLVFTLRFLKSLAEQPLNKHLKSLGKIQIN